MRIGVPKEIKTLEFRVGATPGLVLQLVHEGHEVFVEAGAAAGIGIADAAYADLGATILPNADAVFDAAELIVKVKEPQPIEIARLRPRPHPLHLPAPGRRPRPDAGADAVRLHGDRLRDGHRPLGPAAAAGADEPGGRPHGGRCGRLPPAEAARRARRAAGRRAGGAGRQGDHPRRRRLRQARGGDGDRPPRRRHPVRHLGRPPGGAGRPVRRAPEDRLLHPRRHRRGAAGRRPGDRLRADPRRGGAQAGHPRRRRADARPAR